jgi:hypothetical protein
MSRDVLLVDPNVQQMVAMITQALHGVAQVEPCSGFQEARQRLLAKPPFALVTNLRLQAYNGVHLALLAAMTSTRCLVYADWLDLVLAREVQRLGAFYERSSRLLVALPAFIEGNLPGRDRRDVRVVDRRRVPRGGRRTTDRGLLP